MYTENPVADLDRVSFSYGDGTPPVLHDVRLKIGRRDLVGVIGPNVGGKTTLLKILLGLLEPQEGTARVFGRPPAAVRHRVGYVPQYVSIDPVAPATVLDIVLRGRLRLSSWGPRFGPAHVDAAMAALIARRLPSMILLASAIAALLTTVPRIAVYVTPISPEPAIVLAAGLVFLLASSRRLRSALALGGAASAWLTKTRRLL